MKKRLVVILLSCSFVTSSLSLTACTATHTESTEVESTEENDVDENEDEVESIQEPVDESEEQNLQEGSPEIVGGEDIPSDDEPSPYVEPSPAEPSPAEAPTAEETPSEELVCPQCNRVVSYISRYGVCDECYAANNNFGNCAYCGVALTSAEASSSPTNRCFNCKDVCLICGSHGVDQSQIMEYGDVICGTCYMMYCMPCENCGKVGNLTWSGDGRILCPECIAALNS